MTDSEMLIYDHGDMEGYMQALKVVHAFLHGELSGTKADQARHHLHACRRCVESFEIGYTITEMIRRSQPATAAPAELHNKLTALCFSL